MKNRELCLQLWPCDTNTKFLGMHMAHRGPCESACSGSLLYMLLLLPYGPLTIIMQFRHGRSESSAAAAQKPQPSTDHDGDRSKTCAYSYSRRGACRNMIASGTGLGLPRRGSCVLKVTILGYGEIRCQIFGSGGLKGLPQCRVSWQRVVAIPSGMVRVITTCPAFRVALVDEIPIVSSCLVEAHGGGSALYHTSPHR